MLNVIDVNFDRSEMQLQIKNGSAVTNQTFTSDQIQRFQFGEGTVKAWFTSKTVPQVEIYMKGRADPYVLVSGKAKVNYSEAEAIIREYAAKHDIPIQELE